MKSFSTPSEKKTVPVSSMTAPVRYVDAEETTDKVYSITDIPGTNYFVTLSIQQDRHSRNIGIIPEDKGEITIWLREDNEFKKCRSFRSGCDMDRGLFVDSNLNLIVFGTMKWGKVAFKYWKLSLSPSGVEATFVQNRILEHLIFERDLLLAAFQNGDLAYSEKNSNHGAMIYFLKAGESESRSITLNSFFKSMKGLFLLPGEKKLLVIAKNIPPGISSKELRKLSDSEEKKYQARDHIFCLDLEKLLKLSTNRCNDESVITKVISIDDLGIDLDTEESRIEHAVMLRSGEIALCCANENNTKIFLFNPTTLQPGSARKVCDFPAAVDKIAQLTGDRWLFARDFSESQSGFNLVWNEAKRMPPVLFWGTKEDIEKIIETATVNPKHLDVSFKKTF